MVAKIKLYKVLELLNDEHEKIRFLLDRSETKEDELFYTGKLDEINKLTAKFVKEFQK